MISRFEYLYLKSKLKKHEDTLFHFEFGQIWGEDEYEQKAWIKDPEQTYPTWKKWMSLSEQSKNELKEKWEKYYEECRESPAGKLFFSLYPHFKFGGGISKEELAPMLKKVNEAPRIQKPSSVDPEILVRKMNKYFILKDTIKNMKLTLNEYAEVYEKKSAIDSL